MKITFQRNNETGVSIEELQSTEWLSSGTRRERTQWCTCVRRVVISSCIREPVEVALVLEF
jgi:hypothetical protein